MSTVNTGVIATEQDFVISRIIDTAPTRVFKAWTDPQQFVQWWAPRIFTNTCKMDFRAGGAYRVTMRSPEGEEYPITGMYREITEPKQIVWTMNCNEHPDHWHQLVNQQRPQAKDNIGEMLATTTFEEQNGKTKLTILIHFQSTTDRNALVTIGMADGWNESLDKLQELLAKD